MRRGWRKCWSTLGAADVNCRFRNGSRNEILQRPDIVRVWLKEPMNLMKVRSQCVTSNRCADNNRCTQHNRVAYDFKCHNIDRRFCQGVVQGLSMSRRCIGWRYSTWCLDPTTFRTTSTIAGDPRSLGFWPVSGAWCVDWGSHGLSFLDDRAGRSMQVSVRGGWRAWNSAYESEMKTSNLSRLVLLYQDQVAGHWSFPYVLISCLGVQHLVDMIGKKRVQLYLNFTESGMYGQVVLMHFHHLRWVPNVSRRCSIQVQLGWLHKKMNALTHMGHQFVPFGALEVCIEAQDQDQQQKSWWYWWRPLNLDLELTVWKPDPRLSMLSLTVWDRVHAAS